MKEKGKFAPGTVFEVPNTPAGRAFIKMARRCLNRSFYKIRVNGRGPRTKHALAAGKWDRAFNDRLPLKYAERFAVYLDNDGMKTEMAALFREKSALEEVKRKAEMERLQNEVAALKIILKTRRTITLE